MFWSFPLERDSNRYTGCRQWAVRLCFQASGAESWNFQLGKIASGCQWWHEMDRSWYPFPWTEMGLTFQLFWGEVWSCDRLLLRRKTDRCLCWSHPDSSCCKYFSRIFRQRRHHGSHGGKPIYCNTVLEQDWMSWTLRWHQTSLTRRRCF